VKPRTLLPWVCAASCAGCASAPEAFDAPQGARPQQEPEISFVDPADGAFDISQFLASRIGFMPVPILITEPAVGYGGGLGLMFLHDKLGQRDEEGKHKGTPSISGVAGGYTESDTWFAGAGPVGSWFDDRMRYTGVVGAAHGNLDFFGTGGGPAGTGGERSLPFQIDGFGLRQELLGLVPDTRLYLGLRYEYADTRTHFDSGVPLLDNQQLDTQQAALALVAQVDTRDNILSPNRGANVRLVLSRYDEVFGGDSDYNRIDLDAPFWVPAGEKLVVGLHAQGSVSDDAAPFYSLPYVVLRGVPALRYQGTEVASFEAELRWNFAGRWSLVGFGGLGQAVNSSSDFGGESELICAGGGGFRYLISRVFGLQVGVDVARGPEETAVYVQIGN
jgi:Omp85 superfamily domain